MISINKELEKNITERKQIEHILFESEKKFRAIADTSPLAIYMSEGIEQNAVYINPTFTNLFGYTIDDVPTVDHWWPLAYPDADYRGQVATEWKLKVKTAIEKKTDIEPIEVVVTCKDGTQKNISWGFITIGKENWAFGLDLTERKRAEKAQQAHIQLLTSMEVIDQVVRSATDLDQMMRDVLDAVLSIFDCDRAWLLYPGDPDSPYWQVPMERTVPEYPLSEVLNSELPMQPWIFTILKRVMESDGAVKLGPEEKAPVPSEGRDQFQIQSIIAMAVYPKGDKPWVFGLHQCSFARIWSSDETTLFQEVGRRIADSLTNLMAVRNLQKSEDRFRTLVENIPGFIYRSELKAPWRLQYVSESAFDLTGYSARQFLEAQVLNFGELILAEDLAEVERIVTESVSNGRHYEVEYRIRHASGEVRWVNEKGRDSYDEDGVPLWLDGVIIDITERKLTNEVLKENEATLRSIYESSPMLMGIVELTADNKIVHIYDNPATARFFNVEYKGTKNRVADELGIPSEAISEWLVRYRQCQQENKPVRFEYCHPAPGGPLWLSAIVSIIGPGHNGRTRFSYVAEDITERKQGEMKLQEYAETQAVLLREVNHRVKNNLSVIVGMLHKEEDLAKSKGQTSFLHLLNDLEGRINGLLTVHSMFSDSNWQPLFLSQLCERMISGVLRPYTADIKLNISASKVRVDSNQAHHLSMVINELATNTLKYAIGEPAQTCIDVDITEEAGKVFLTFRDNGPGYPENIIWGKYTGTSIGFDLITGIVKKSLRGTLSFKNENGAVAQIVFDTYFKTDRDGS